MRLLTGIPLFALVACGSSSGAAPQSQNDALSDPTYEHAVLAASWHAIPGAPTVTGGAKQDDIYFPSPRVGYAVSGPASSIYKTEDGGWTWRTVLTQPGTYFRSILFVDDNHGFASNLGAGLAPSITDTNVLYETKDGGATWNPVSSISGPMPQGICNQTKIDSWHLVALGRVAGPCYVMTSSDGGESWTSRDMNGQFQMLIDAHFTSPTNGIAVGGSAGSTMYCTIMHTSDGGDTWQTVFTSTTPDTLCWKISFPSDRVGYVSVQDTDTGPPTFVKTTDGGRTWTEKPLPANTQGLYPGIGIGFITDRIGWVSADDPTLPTYRTTNGGETWTPDANLESPINRFRFRPTSAFAIGASVWRLDVDDEDYGP
jgi:photosystem II stability/assembly factor-like uncharacterized protein